MKIFPQTRRAWARLGVLVGSVVLLSALGGLWMFSMPGKSHSGPLPDLSSDEVELRGRLETEVRVLSEQIGEHNVFHPEALAQSEAHIKRSFADAGYSVSEQVYDVAVGSTHTVRNIEVEIKGKSTPEEIVVVGAHYDTVEGCPGANDNTSGTVAVLELARLLKGREFGRTVRFVAFVNEEPPFFQTEAMGSLVYARRCKARKEKIVAMLSLETIGSYSDVKGSQAYPFPFSLFYPNTGNFIAFVANVRSRSLARRAVRTFRKNVQFPSEGVAAPGSIPGLGWSDHWSFWREGYPAIMITDTAPFRYAHYHTPHDTPDKLDYDRMARVVLGLIPVVEDLAGK